jgi:hypothetical protein
MRSGNLVRIKLKKIRWTGQFALPPERSPSACFLKDNETQIYNLNDFDTDYAGIRCLCSIGRLN